MEQLRALFNFFGISNTLAGMQWHFAIDTILVMWSLSLSLYGAYSLWFNFPFNEYKRKAKTAQHAAPWTVETQNVVTQASKSPPLQLIDFRPDMHPDSCLSKNEVTQMDKLETEISCIETAVDSFLISLTSKPQKTSGAPKMVF